MLSLLKLIAPTILTLAVGTYWLNRLFIARANFAALVERICNALDSLKDDCAEYWSVPYTADKEPEQSVLEAKIKGRVQQISSLIGLVADKRPNMPASIHGLLVDLLDACTGGDFETKARNADRGRFMRIVATIYKLTVELQRLKIWSGAVAEFIDERCSEFGNRGRGASGKVL
jgi:hypothetical protein